MNCSPRNNRVRNAPSFPGTASPCTSCVTRCRERPPRRSSPQKKRLYWPSPGSPGRTFPTARLWPRLHLRQWCRFLLGRFHKEHAAMRLQYYQDCFTPHNAEECAALIRQLHTPEKEFAAFWLCQADVLILGLFIHGDVACLCHKPTLSWSRNKSPGVAPDETVTFELENGERDEIPADTCVPTEQAISAFLEFYRTGRLSPILEWQ